MQKVDKPYYDKRIFWDIDYTKLNYELKANFIIERVFERGDVEDIRYCRRFYGDEKVADALLNAKFLSDLRLSLACAIINKPKKDFRCYSLKQLTPTLYPY